MYYNNTYMNNNWSSSHPPPGPYSGRGPTTAGYYDSYSQPPGQYQQPLPTHGYSSQDPRVNQAYLSLPRRNDLSRPSSAYDGRNNSGPSYQPQPKTYSYPNRGEVRNPPVVTASSNGPKPKTDQQLYEEAVRDVKYYETKLKEIALKKSALEKEEVESNRLHKRAKAESQRLQYLISTKCQSSNAMSSTSVTSSSNMASRLPPQPSRLPTTVMQNGQAVSHANASQSLFSRIEQAPSGQSNFTNSLFSVPSLLPGPLTSARPANNVLTSVRYKPLSLVYEDNVEELISSQIFPSSKGFRQMFKLTSEQTDYFKNVSYGSEKRIILRCCIFDRTSYLQSDHISVKMTIKLNNSMVYIGNTKKQPTNGPLDLTKECNRDGSGNNLEISLSPDTLGVYAPAEYGVTLMLVNKLTVESSMNCLKINPRYARSAEDTKRRVTSKFSQTSEVACDTDSIKVSLICPISKQRLEFPSMGNNCEHLTCFSARTFIELNHVKNEWSCPICRKFIGMDDLRVDGLLLSVLNECKPICKEVEFDASANWKPVEEYNTANEQRSTATVDDVLGSPDIITIESSDDEDPQPPVRIAVTARVPPLTIHRSFEAELNAADSATSGSNDSSDSVPLARMLKRRRISDNESSDEVEDSSNSDASSSSTSKSEDSESEYESAKPAKKQPPRRVKTPQKRKAAPRCKKVAAAAARKKR